MKLKSSPTAQPSKGSVVTLNFSPAPSASLAVIIGDVHIVEAGQHKFTIRDTQNIISGKNQLNGLFPYVNLATTNNTFDRERIPNA